MTPILSILTPTIPARESLLAALSAEIMTQIEEGGFHGKVEHLSFSDNRTRSIGAKRQALVDIARGDYVAFVVAETREAARNAADRSISTGARVGRRKRSAGGRGTIRDSRKRISKARPHAARPG